MTAMQICPRCGLQNPPDARGCTQCGLAFSQPALTLMGHAAPAIPAPPGTGLPGQPHAPPADARQALRGTMIGMTPPNAPIPTPAHVGPAPQSASAQPGHAHRFAQTMLGGAAPQWVSPPPDAVPNANHAQPAAGTSPQFDLGRANAPAAATIVGNPPIHSATKTVLGVARPGVAPLHPGEAKARPAATELIKPQPAPAPAARAAPPPQQAAPAARLERKPVERERLPVVPARRAEAPGSPKKKQQRPRIPLLAAAALIGAACLFAAAGVAWFLARGHGSLEARIELSPSGAERLGLTCARCDDGSSAELDGKTAAFAAHHASLELVRPIKVGENALSISLTTKGGSPSSVSLSVPLDFRVRGDLGGLDADKPELRVLVNALPGSLVQVDGQSVPLSADGQASYGVDVSRDLTGPEPTVQRLVRKLSYAVTPPGGTMQSGEVSLQVGVVPLVIDAPGPSIVLETPTFVLAGGTLKGGSLKVGERPITVDPAGRFAQMMNVSSLGETTIVVRASAKDYAPRLMPVRVRRVESLAKEAERLRKQMTSSYNALTSQMDVNHALDVALEGFVSDVRSESYTTVVLLDIKDGCAKGPCLVKVSCGTALSLSKRDKVQTIGKLVGSVDGPRTGSRIPHVSADFLVKVGR